MRKITFFFSLILILSFQLNIKAQTNSVQIVGGSYYNSITAAWAALGTISSAKVIEIQSSYTGANETFPISLGAVSGASATNTVTIRPATGISSISITSSNATGTILLNQCSYVIFDGEAGGTGGAKNLIVENTATTGYTIKFNNYANNNTIKYCTVKGVTVTANNTPTCAVIFFNPASNSTGNSNNTITYCDIKDGATLPQVLILSGGASYNNSNNTISYCNLYDFFSAAYNSYGIYINSSNTGWTISNNSFYQTATMTSTAGSTQYGIYNYAYNGGGFTISGNYFGGGAANCGGTAWNVGGSYANRFVGIFNYSGLTGSYNNIQGNTIGNFNWTTTSTATTSPGIWCGIYLYGGYVNTGTTTGNVIGSTSATTASVSITSSASGSGSSYGINIGSGTTAIISKNSISSISAGISSSSYQANFYGIYSFMAATISKNFIHNIGIASTSSTSSVLAGIYLNITSNGANVQNNMISLGKDPAGNDVTLGATIYGIYEAASCLNSTHYFNSVYICGTVSGSSMNSYDFYTGAPNTNCNLKNNIFSNQRTGGGVLHGAIYISSATYGVSPGFTSNYNIFYTAGSLGYYGVTIVNLDNWRQGTFQDYNSSSGNPMFNTPAGSNVTTDLHLQSTNPAEGAGIDVGITDDYDGQTRSTLTPVDIGANAGNFTYTDKVPPNIIYTPLTNTTSTSNPTFNATITDNKGISSGASLPRVYYKKSTDNNTFGGNTSSDNGWKYTTTGSTSSPYSFTIDYSIIYGGSVTAGTQIQYFVVAQDDAYNLASNPYGATSSTNPPVQNINGKATTPNSYYISNALSGTVTVGTSGATYTSLTKSGGLFSAINSGVLSGNLTVNIITDVTSEDGTNSLSQWVEQGAGGYTLTINPSGGVTRTISGSVSGPLINLNGVSRTTIDGLNSAGNALKFENTGTGSTASTIKFINGANSNTVTNCIVYGHGSGYSGSSSGCPILFSSSSPSSGNINNTISNCDIGSNGSNMPWMCIYSYGTSGYENYGNTISGNTIHDYGNAGTNPVGIYLDVNSSNTSNTSWTISNNKIYQTNTLLVNGRSYCGIYINTTSGDGYSITGNIIGYASANQTGICTIGSSGTSTAFIGIYVNAATTRSSSVQNNTIGGVNMMSNGASSSYYSYGIWLNAGNFSTFSGNTITGISFSNYSASAVNNYIINNSTSGATISNNTITGVTFNVAATSASTAYGIYNTGASCSISNNSFSSVTVASLSGGTGTTFYGIYSSGTGGTTTISSNTIGSTSANNITSDQTSGQLIGIRTLGSNSVTQQSDTVRNLTHSGANTGTTSSASIIGMYFSASGTSGITIGANAISNLYNSNSTSGVNVLGLYYSGPTSGTNNVYGNFINALITNSSSTSAAVYGLYIAAGVTTYYNNIISLGSGISTDNIIEGIYEIGTSGNNCYLYFNTVYIGGSVSSSTINSYALYNNANSNTRNFRDNILVNARNNSSGTAKHYTISLAGTTNVTLDYNDYWISGTGGILGYNGGDKTALPIVTGQDSHSLNVDPQFVSPADANGTTSSDYQATNGILSGAGITISGISTDFSGYTRPSPPSLGGIENGNPLPVEISSFSANISEQRNVILKWVTDKEQNNAGFEIQKSGTGNQNSENNWTKIGYIAGNGNKNTPTNYSFTDAKLSSGKYKYRLKQIDFNGNFHYYNLNGNIEIGVPKDYNISQNYPNPFNPATKIDIDLPFDSKVNLKIYDLSGREVKTLMNEIKQAGYYTVEFNASSIASGVYFYRIIAEGKGQKFVMTKKMAMIK